MTERVVLVRFCSIPSRTEREPSVSGPVVPLASTRFVAEVALMAFSAGNFERVAEHEDSQRSYVATRLIATFSKFRYALPSALSETTGSFFS
jgi:hypothetical protein